MYSIPQFLYTHSLNIMHTTYTVFLLANYYHYTNLTFVRESGRSREAIRPELKRFPTLHRWTWTLREVAH